MKKEILKKFQGQFHVKPDEFREKLAGIKAFVFDWDGVFNDGSKNEKGTGSFNEVDSMGVNLLRFSHYHLRRAMPYTAIITGERNETAFSFAKREHFHAVYFSIKKKQAAMDHFCKAHTLDPSDICFLFDDVTDLSVASIAGLRIKMGNDAQVMLNHYIAEQKLADYTTGNSGGRCAIREASELIIGFREHFDEIIGHRIAFSETYQNYLQQRNAVTTELIN